MGDWYNDPPEEPEVPECCDEEMQALEDGTCVCMDCGRRIAPARDIEPPDETYEDVGDPGCRECGKPADGCVYCSSRCAEKNPCPHGNTPGECGECDHWADLAYDATK